MLTECALVDRVREELKQVLDPELGINIVDLGLVRDVAVDREMVRVRMTLTSAACPMGASLAEEVRESVARLAPGLRAEVDLEWEPPWSPDMMSPEAKKHLGW